METSKLAIGSYTVRLVLIILITIINIINNKYYLQSPCLSCCLFTDADEWGMSSHCRGVLLRFSHPIPPPLPSPAIALATTEHRYWRVRISGGWEL